MLSAVPLLVVTQFTLCVLLMVREMPEVPDVGGGSEYIRPQAEGSG
jgi:hypothetical protein